MLTTNRTQLKVDDILEKEFKKQVRGYNEADVDEFLDTIIKDYEAFTKEIERLKQENDRFKKSKEHQEHQEHQEQQTKTRSNASGITQVNYDVLKRLSNLEKEVFGQKRNELEG